MAKVIHGTYYPHIDGIRTLAVLPVVLYHLLSMLCPGGYAGVDVFFVISGYLITGGILRELEKKTFTLSSFYHRRVRRIIPAYFVLIIGVLAFGACVYGYINFGRLGETALYSVFYATNIYFQWHSGYFDAIAHTNPLLNLWSLAVEEQFYIFLPLAMLVLWRIKPRVKFVVCILLLGLFLSFAFNIFCMERHRSFASLVAFYQLPSRAWELLAGSLLATLPASLGRFWQKKAPYLVVREKAHFRYLH